MRQKRYVFYVNGSYSDTESWIFYQSHRVSFSAIDISQQSFASYKFYINQFVGFAGLIMIMFENDFQSCNQFEWQIGFYFIDKQALWHNVRYSNKTKKWFTFQIDDKLIEFCRIESWNVQFDFIELMLHSSKYITLHRLNDTCKWNLTGSIKINLSFTNSHIFFWPIHIFER